MTNLTNCIVTEYSRLTALTLAQPHIQCRPTCAPVLNLEIHQDGAKSPYWFLSFCGTTAGVREETTTEGKGKVAYK